MLNVTNNTICFKGSQWGVCCLRHRLSEDVSRRTDRIYPLAHKPDAQVRARLRWSISVGEKRVCLQVLWRASAFTQCVLLLCVLQREAKLQLFREAVDAHTALTEQVTELKLNSVRNLLVTDHLILLCFFTLCSGTQRTRHRTPPAGPQAAGHWGWTEHSQNLHGYSLRPGNTLETQDRAGVCFCAVWLKVWVREDASCKQEGQQEVGIFCL